MWSFIVILMNIILLLIQLIFHQIVCSTRNVMRWQYGVSKWYEIVKRLGTPVLLEGEWFSNNIGLYIFLLTLAPFLIKMEEDFQVWVITVNNAFSIFLFFRRLYFNLCLFCAKRLQEISCTLKFLSIYQQMRCHNEMNSFPGGHNKQPNHIWLNSRCELSLT